VTEKSEALHEIEPMPAPKADTLSPDAAAAWFAIHTFPRHEKGIAHQLSVSGVENYLPTLTQLHQWSDRRKKVDLPLFPCYTFVHIHPSAEHRVKVLRVPGVIGFVGGARQGTPIPDRQIDNIRALLISRVAFDPFPFLKIGQRVRIRGGSLDGIEGILMRRNGIRRLVISVDSLERSLSLCVEGLNVEAI
jgi:transcription antitermination factor NusG